MSTTFWYPKSLFLNLVRTHIFIGQMESAMIQLMWLFHISSGFAKECRGNVPVSSAAQLKVGLIMDCCSWELIYVFDRALSLQMMTICLFPSEQVCQFPFCTFTYLHVHKPYLCDQPSTCGLK